MQKSSRRKRIRLKALIDGPCSASIFYYSVFTSASETTRLVHLTPMRLLEGCSYRLFPYLLTRKNTYEAVPPPLRECFFYRASNPWAAKNSGSEAMRQPRQSQPCGEQASASSRGDMASRKSVSFSLSQSPFRFPFSSCLLLTVCSWSRGQED